MSLLNLAARVCNTFASDDNLTRTVQKVKQDQRRDVVTGLDLHLHAVARDYAAEHLPDHRFISEEDEPAPDDIIKALTGNSLIVDPLDGSNNHALDLPGFGFMAARLQQGVVAGAVIVLPEHDRYIVFERGELLLSQALPTDTRPNSATVYYAYPPSQSTQARTARYALQDLIDARSAGLYRYGSACIGLYNLLAGRHTGFIGHGIRIWDALAYLPVLSAMGIACRYHIQSSAISLIASRDEAFLQAASTVLLQTQGINLHVYQNTSPLICEPS